MPETSQGWKAEGCGHLLGVLDSSPSLRSAGAEGGGEQKPKDQVAYGLSFLPLGAEKVCSSGDLGARTQIQPVLVSLGVSPWACHLISPTGWGQSQRGVHISSLPLTVSSLSSPLQLRYWLLLLLQPHPGSDPTILL